MLNVFTALPLVSELSNLEQVLLTVIQGAVEIPDPTGQKSCFTILKRLIELWGELEKYAWNLIG